MEAEYSKFILRVTQVTKSFGATRVLKGVDFAVAAGEVHALLGGNGAGKSTLIKIVAGELRQDSGTVQYGAKHDGVAQDRVAEAAIAVVHQEFALLPHLTVAENIALPRWRSGIGFVDSKQTYETARAALSLIDPTFAKDAVGRQVLSLALHEQQLVEIARALSSGARLLLLDEPTANLTAEEAEGLFEVLRRLIRKTGIAVVFVSHRMKEIRAIADVCTIVRDGTTPISRRPLSDLSDSEIIENMGQTVVSNDDMAREPTHSDVRATRADQRVDFTLTGPNLRIQVPSGSVVGLAGAPAGPLKVIQALAGSDPGGPFRCFLDGVDATPASPREATMKRIGYVSGDRAGKGILASLPIIDNIVASKRISGRKMWAARAEEKDAESALKLLNIKVGSLWDLPSTLSGGNQQKLLIARWLVVRPSLLVLEEPTRGIDISTKKEIYKLIRRISSEGTSLVWWSTEYAELADICDTVIAFDPDGRVTAVLEGHEVTEERMGTATGVAA